MRYCNSCVLPDTRPNLKILEDGRCNACHSWNNKKTVIDWKKREKDLYELIAQIKKKSNSWDCVIPVSGGKDSTWQVVKALEFGLKPLCVTWKTPGRNELGQKNLQNLINLGVDHIDYSINPKVEKIFTLETLKKSGSVAIPMHMALFAIPLRMAVNYKIPLVLWGENSAIEYGGDDQELLGFKMNNKWLRTYGVTQGTVASDWVSENLTIKDLSSYLWPSDQELEEAGITAAFLGWYIPWDPVGTYEFAKKVGFSATEKPKTGYYQFADVDDDFIISIHHWLKWYKFGFTRLWDNLSIEIRAKRIRRDDALEIIKKTGDEYPGEVMQKFCTWSNINKEQFIAIIENFRNMEIWKNINNSWQIKNFLLEEWDWQSIDRINIVTAHPLMVEVAQTASGETILGEKFSEVPEHT